MALVPGSVYLERNVIKHGLLGATPRKAIFRRRKPSHSQSASRWGRSGNPALKWPAGKIPFSFHHPVAAIQANPLNISFYESLVGHIRLSVLFSYFFGSFSGVMILSFNGVRFPVASTGFDPA